MTATARTVPINLAVARTQGRVIVAARLTTAPGLVVHPAPHFPEVARLTHQPSGRALADFPDIDWALEAAHRLAGVADWRRPADELQDETIARRVDQTVRDCGGEFRTRPGGIGAHVKETS